MRENADESLQRVDDDVGEVLFVQRVTGVHHVIIYLQQKQPTHALRVTLLLLQGSKAHRFQWSVQTEPRYRKYILIVRTEKIPRKPLHTRDYY